MSQYPGPDMSQADTDSHKRYGSSESETKPSGSSSSVRKRASRAGTRSVSNLSAAQLERKRANDREAQRAIRQRTKDHIEELERKVAEAVARERVCEAQEARIKELEQENAYLKSRMPNEVFLLGLPGNESKQADSALGHSTQTSPHTRYTGEHESRPASQATRHSVSASSATAQSRPEVWRQQTHPAAFNQPESAPPSARPEPMRSASWRNPSDLPVTSPGQPLSAATGMEQAARSFSQPSSHDRPSWTGSANYQYMMDPGQTSQNYSAQRQSMSMQSHQHQQQQQHQHQHQHQQQQQQQQQPPPYSIPPGVPAPSSHPQAYGAPLATPSAEFQNLSMQSPANANPQHEQGGQDHTPYTVQASHMQNPQAYQPQAQQPNMARPSLAPSYNQPATSNGYPQPGMTQTQQHVLDYQGPPSGQPALGQPGYSYGSY